MDLDAIHAHIGQKIRNRREATGRDLADVARAAGMDMKLLSRMELGRISIPSGRLWNLSIALNVPISYFYEGLPR